MFNIEIIEYMDKFLYNNVSFQVWDELLAMENVVSK